MTNILILPDVEVSVDTGTNEDWIDVFLFTDVLGNEVSLEGIAFYMELRRHPGDHEVALTASTEDGRLRIGGVNSGVLQITVPQSVMEFVGAGDFVTNVMATADGHTCKVIDAQPVTIFQGVTRTAAPASSGEDESNILVLPMLDIVQATGNNEDWLLNITYRDLNDEPLSLEHIDFAMQLRSKAESHSALLDASVANGKLSVGVPDEGTLSIQVPLADMKRLFAGNYVSDIVATSSTRRRVIVRSAVEIVEGITT